MDRPIDREYRTRRIVKRVAVSVIVVVAAAALLMGASSFIRPSVSRATIRTARVDSGPIEATIQATGIVVPEFEQVVSSPVDARIVRVLQRPGALLEKGEPILQLDLGATVLALDRVDQDLALKENQQARTRLDLESTLGSLKSQIEIEGLELENLKAITERDRKLFAEGLVSREMHRQSELNEARAGVELAQLEQAERIARRSNEMQLRGLALEMETLRKERREAERRLDLATTRSDRRGVLTYVAPEEGATVRGGDVLARIADLTAFRVEATISDVHSNRIAAGMPAQVLVGEARLGGTVSRILPTIQNGVVTLSVTLDDRSNPLLRSNLRVDVLLVTDHKAKALRLKKGPFAGGEGSPEVFVLRGGRAVRTPVRLGVSDFDRYEVVAGLSEGDEVIVSDTSSIQHLKEVRVR